MRALLVVNPRPPRRLPGPATCSPSALASEVRLEVVETKRRGHATEIARSAVGRRRRRRGRASAATARSTRSSTACSPTARAERTPPLAVVPGGSANVFARALGLPSNAVDATSVLLEALRRASARAAIGLGRADDQWFTFCAGIGLDAAVVRRVDARRARGARATPALFVRQGFAALLPGPAAAARAAAAHAPAPRSRSRSGLALVCNTRPVDLPRRAPRCTPARDASFDTGLDLFGLRRLRTFTDAAPPAPDPVGPGARRTGARWLTGARRGGAGLTADRPVPFQVDGDDLGDRTGWSG